MIELPHNEAAFSLLVTNKLGKGDRTYCIVGTAKDMTLHPRTWAVGYIYIYYFDDEGKLKQFHKTPTEDVPLCFDVIGNRLCVGIGPILRIYDLGQKINYSENERTESFNQVLTKLEQMEAEYLSLISLIQFMFWSISQRSDNYIFLQMM